MALSESIAGPLVEPFPAPHLALAAAMPETALKADKRGGATRLWEIAHRYHCPIIGTCLHVDELRRLAKKADGWAAGPLSDYQVHVSFVGAAETKNPLSVATQKRLDRKYAASIRHFSRVKDPRDIAELWRLAVAAGDIPGPFWALMSHPCADQQVRTLAYEDVHMLSHQVGAGLCTEARELAAARARIAELERERIQQARRHEQRLAARDQALAGLAQQLAQAKEAASRSVAALRPPVDRAEDLSQGSRVAALEAELQALRQRHVRSQQEALGLRREKEAAAEQARLLAAELAEAKAAVLALERVLSRRQDEAERDGCIGGRDCRACLDLRGRRILCIGGRGTLAEHYRDLVARCNGELVRHDGGMEDSHHRLEAMLAAADAVVCPADFVSHNAYHRAKRFCKRHAKPCILLRSSGIASFARALEQLAA